MSTHHRTYHARRAEYDKIRHALDGQAAMRDNAALYLRRPDGLTANEWANYVKGAHFYPVAETTLRTMVGLCSRREPKFTLPPRLQPMIEMATYEADSLAVLSEKLLREVLSVGRVCALLDFAEEGNTILTPRTSRPSTRKTSSIGAWASSMAASG